MTVYPDRLTEIIYKASGVNLTTAQRIAKKITEEYPNLLIDSGTGYRLPAGKAPLLTEKEIQTELNYANEAMELIAPKDWEMNKYLRVAKAQNDADHKFYIGGMNETILF